MIKKEINKLEIKKNNLNLDDNNKEFTLELLKRLDCKYEEETDSYLFNKELCMAFKFDSLTRIAKREIIHRLINSLEIERDKNYNIKIKNIKFTDEFISKSPKEYIEYLKEILQNDKIGIIHKSLINEMELEELKKDYFVFSLSKMDKENYQDITQKYV